MTPYRIHPTPGTSGTRLQAQPDLPRQLALPSQGTGRNASIPQDGQSSAPSLEFAAHPAAKAWQSWQHASVQLRASWARWRWLRAPESAVGVRWQKERSGSEVRPSIVVQRRAEPHRMWSRIVKCADTPLLLRGCLQYGPQAMLVDPEMSLADVVRRAQAAWPTLEFTLHEVAGTGAYLTFRGDVTGRDAWHRWNSASGKMIQLEDHVGGVEVSVARVLGFEAGPTAPIANGWATQWFESVNTRFDSHWPTWSRTIFRIKIEDQWITVSRSDSLQTLFQRLSQLRGVCCRTIARKAAPGYQLLVWAEDGCLDVEDPEGLLVLLGAMGRSQTLIVPQEASLIVDGNELKWNSNQRVPIAKGWSADLLATGAIDTMEANELRDLERALPGWVASTQLLHETLGWNWTAQPLNLDSDHAGLDRMEQWLFGQGKCSEHGWFFPRGPHRPTSGFERTLLITQYPTGSRVRIPREEIEHAPRESVWMIQSHLGGDAHRIEWETVRRLQVGESGVIGPDHEVFRTEDAFEVKSRRLGAWSGFAVHLLNVKEGKEWLAEPGADFVAELDGVPLIGNGAGLAGVPHTQWEGLRLEWDPLGSRPTEVRVEWTAGMLAQIADGVTQAFPELQLESTQRSGTLQSLERLWWRRRESQARLAMLTRDLAKSESQSLDLRELLRPA